MSPPPEHLAKTHGRRTRILVLVLLVVFAELGSLAHARGIRITILGNGQKSPLTVAPGATVVFQVKVRGCPPLPPYSAGWFDVWNLGPALQAQPTNFPQEPIPNSFFINSNNYAILYGYALARSPCHTPTSPVSYLAPTTPGRYTVWYGFSYVNCYFGFCSFYTSILAEKGFVLKVSNLSGLAGFAVEPSTTAASTCAPDEITVTALDAAGNTLTSYDGTVTLTTSSGHGNWSLVQGQGTFAPGAPDSGIATYSFSPLDQGQAVFALSDTHADDLTAQAIDTVTTLSGTSPTIEYRDNVFRLTPVNPPADGSAVVVAGRPETFRVEMLDRNPATGSCGPAPGYDATSLKAWISRTPQDPGAPGPTANGSPLPNAAPPGNNLVIPFTNGVAQLSLQTSDVGQWSIDLEDDTSGYALNLQDQARTIMGASPVLTVRPFGLAWSAVSAGPTQNPGTTTPSGAIFTKAGLPFSATVTAVLWQQGDPASGVPTAPIDAANHTAAQHYAWTTTLSASAPYEPSAGVLGTLSGGPLAQGSFRGGSAQANALAYSEVGSVSLEAQANDYLDASQYGAKPLVEGLSVPVGRFTPDAFDVSVNTPTFNSGCGANFTYLGEPMNYATPPVVTITAVNAQNQTTLDYSDYGTGEDWWKLPEIQPSYTDPNAPANLGVTVDSSAASFAPGTETNTSPGSVTVTFSGPLAYTMPDNGTKPAPVASPFSSDIHVSFPVTDSDGISYANNPFQFTIGFAPGDSSTIEQGRLYLGNAYGSELLDLNPLMETQIYAGTNEGWIASTNDACTTGVSLALENPDPSQPLTPADTCVWESGGNLSGLSCGSGKTGEDFTEPPVQGNFNLWFKAPGVPGVLTLTTGSIPNWLEYDWSGTGQDNQPPTASLNFGLYPGNPHLIYLRVVH
jgi:MSHA biogenesis protein MshQ